MPSYLHQIVTDVSREYPSNIAIIDSSRSITYKELEKAIDCIAARLVGLGLRKGERLGIISRNSIEYVAVFFAASQAGAVSVPLNNSLKPVGIAEQAVDCSISGLYYGKGMEDVAKEVKKKARSVRFMIGDAELKSASFGKLSAGKAPSDPATIIYTSGTTAKPLGVMLSHKNLISNAISVAKYLRLKPSDKACCVLPLYYIYGLSVLLSHLSAGATVVLDNRFMYPNLVLDTIEKEEATTFAGVPSHYAILMDTSDIARRKLPSLRRFLQAGDRMPEELTKRLLKAFPRKEIYLMYGQTEASPRLTYLDPKLTRKKPGSVGKAIPGVKVKVIDRSGRECRPKEEGEIIAKGDNVMMGYWNNKAETNKVISKSWLYTGDIGYKDAAGDLLITGRMKDIVKIAGNRVSLIEVEEAASKIKGVSGAVAIAVPDKVLGNKVILFITMNSTKPILGNKIMYYCKSRLPDYKSPHKVIIIKEMPRNSFGKIDMGCLRNSI